MASPRTGVPRGRLLLPLVALVGVTVAGCDLAVSRSRSASPPRPTTTTTTSTTVTTTTPVSRPLQANTAGGVVDLARQPCAALDQDQAVALGAQGAGKQIEIDIDDSPACRWSTPAAVFGFFPKPDKDLTTDPATQRRSSPTRISGHDARTGIQGADGANCIVTVSAGNGQSFEVLLAPIGANPRGDALCAGLGINVAAAVLTHLP